MVAFFDHGVNGVTSPHVYIFYEALLKQRNV